MGYPYVRVLMFFPGPNPRRLFNEELLSGTVGLQYYSLGLGLKLPSKESLRGLFMTKVPSLA